MDITFKTKNTMDRKSENLIFILLIIAFLAECFIFLSEQFFINSYYFVIPFLVFILIASQSRNIYLKRNNLFFFIYPLLLSFYIIFLIFNQDNQGLWGFGAFYKKSKILVLIVIGLWQWSLYPPAVFYLLKKLILILRVLRKNISLNILSFIILFLFFILFRDKAISFDGKDWIEVTEKNEWWMYLREVYTMFIFRLTYLALSKLGTNAELSIALTSSVFGIIFFMILIRIADFIKSSTTVKRGLFFWGIFGTYGITQLFAGHIEVYGIFIAVALGYVYLSFLYLENKMKLYYVAIFFAFLMGIHIAAIWLLPSFALLPFMKNDKKSLPVKELSMSFILMIFSGILLTAPIICLYYDWSIMNFWNRGFISVTDTPDNRVFLSYANIFSISHIWDMINLYFFNFSGIIFLIIYGLINKIIYSKMNRYEVFLLLIVVPSAIFSFIYRLGRGAIRDWDSFSILSLGLSLFMLFKILNRPKKELPNNYVYDLFPIIFLFVLITIFQIIQNYYNPFL